MHRAYVERGSVMGTHNPPRFIVFCVSCGVVEERAATTEAPSFEGFDAVIAWNGQHAVVWSARCRKCGMSAVVREQPPS